MYQELSGGNIKGHENELDEKLEGTLALKLDWKKIIVKEGSWTIRGIITSFHWKNNQLPSFKNNHTYTLG